MSHHRREEKEGKISLKPTREIRKEMLSITGGADLVLREPTTCKGKKRRTGKKTSNNSKPVDKKRGLWGFFQTIILFLRKKVGGRA